MNKGRCQTNGVCLLLYDRTFHVQFLLYVLPHPPRFASANIACENTSHGANVQQEVAHTNAKVPFCLIIRIISYSIYAWFGDSRLRKQLCKSVIVQVIFSFLQCWDAVV